MVDGRATSGLIPIAHEMAVSILRSALCRHRIPSNEVNITMNERFLLTDYYSLLAVFDSTVLHLLGID